MGYATQLGTVRMLGLFLPAPGDVPVSVARFVAGQLGIADPGCLGRSRSRPEDGQ